MGDFPYPNFSDQQKAWFNTLLEGMVTNPDALNWARIKGQRDLELIIAPADEDAHVFSDEVCFALQTLAASVTGVLQPIIYLSGQPHQLAAQSAWEDQYFI